MFLIYFLSATLILSAEAWIVEVDSYGEECFYELVEEVNTKIGLTFQVIEGGFMEVDVSITAPDGYEIYVGYSESGGKYTFSANQKGKYKFCFSNLESSHTTKQVMFDILVGLLDERGEPLDAPEPVSNQTSRLEGMVKELKQALGAVSHEQSYLMARMNWHHQLSEHMNMVVVRWTLFETALVLTGAAFQVWYILRFFEVRRML